MSSSLDQLFTPKQIAQRGIMSLVMQWKERSSGQLEFYKIGRRVLYSEQHILNYLAQRESKKVSHISSHTT